MPPPPSPHAPPLSSSPTAQTLSPHAPHPHFHYRFPIHRSVPDSGRSYPPSAPFLHWKPAERFFKHGLAAAATRHRAVSAPPRRPARLAQPAGKLAVPLWEHHETPSPPQLHHGNSLLHQSCYSAEASHLASCSLGKNCKECVGDGTHILPISGGREADSGLLKGMACRSTKQIQLWKGALILSNKIQLAEPRNRTSPTYIVRVLNHRRGQLKRVSAVAALRVRPRHTHIHVQKLGGTHKLAFKESDKLLDECSEESSSLYGKEGGKVNAVVLSMKEDLEEEHRAKKRLEIRNMKLSKNLSQTNKALRTAMAELRNERKSRGLMEGMCNKMAKEIEQDKLQMDGLKRELVGAREEVEEERNMLHLADIWREERLQMKLEDARIELEGEQQVVKSLRSELRLLKCGGNYVAGCDHGDYDSSEIGMVQDEYSAFSPVQQFHSEQLEELEFAMD